ncbi:HD-GYP domain-containing protein, partial [Thermodesulfitimonas sp.]
HTTAGHQRRVAQLACAIAQEMGLPPDQVVGLRVAGMLHDIGKIYVPAEILSKPGRISEYEFSIIKTHPEVGYDIVKEIEFPWPVAQIILQHHERLNGSGYPVGLRDKEILLEARILAVADVVEAMSSHRPALGTAAALAEISEKSGLLYDPTVVNVCLRLFTEKGFRLA